MKNGPPRISARLTDDGAFVEMTGGAWSARIPAESVTAWRRFYARLAERESAAAPFKGERKYAAIYEPTVRELERVEAEIAARANAAI